MQLQKCTYSVTAAVQLQCLHHSSAAVLLMLRLQAQCVPAYNYCGSSLQGMVHSCGKEFALKPQLLLRFLCTLPLSSTAGSPRLP